MARSIGYIDGGRAGMARLLALGMLDARLAAAIEVAKSWGNSCPECGSSDHVICATQRKPVPHKDPELQAWADEFQED